jgi:hypothetical protein
MKNMFSGNQVATKGHSRKSVFSTRPAGSLGDGFGRRNGQVLIFAVLTLTLMFGAMGLSMDLGWDYFLKQRVQTAADAAASAASVYALNNGDTCSTVTCGTALNCTGITAPPTSSLQAGCLYAMADGPPILTASTIENNAAHPPSGLTGVTPAMWIQVTVSAANHNSFLYMWGFTTASIRASAIAGVNIPTGSCIYALGTGSIPDALSITGTSSITTTGCGVYVNSSSPSALYLYGSPTLTAKSINVVGETSISGGSTASPTPTTGASPIADPFATLPAPSFSGCDQTNYSIDRSHTATLSQGVYCGGMSITGNATVTLNPGVYILNGGGLTISNSATVTGSHVMFYNTATSSETIGPVSITGNPVVTLSAPNSGTYEGVVFYQDRTQTYAAVNTIANSSTGIITGTYYFPTTAFSFTGNVSTPIYEAFIAQTISITGSSSLESDASGTYTGLTIPTASLMQ